MSINRPSLVRILFDSLHTRREQLDSPLINHPMYALFCGGESDEDEDGGDDDDDNDNDNDHDAS